MVVTLKSKIHELSGVGEKYASKLHRLKIETVEDLLLYLPKKWEDFSKITPIRDLRGGETACIRGSIWSIGSKRSIKKRMSITEAIIADETGTAKAVWFNQAFLTKSLKMGDELLLAGKVESHYGNITMQSPAYEKTDKETLTHLGRIVPIYGETEGLSSRWLRFQMRQLIKIIYSFKEYLPEEVIKHQNLISFPAAIRQLHFPENSFQLEKAQERISFDEMFLLQLAVGQVKKKLEEERSISIRFNQEMSKKFIQKLGFQLTEAQKRAAWEIIKDLEKPVPMNRLVEGDVGSGKTAVAAMAILQVLASGFQAALVAPTEILAKQHFAKMQSLFNDFGIKTNLLLGKTKKKEREEIFRQIREGEIQFIVGTHSLFSPELSFDNLALVVIDEQHRFGIEQRGKIKGQTGQAGRLPHFLSMSATPIPRTLAISIYGDLDISVIDEMPPSRKKVATFLIPNDKKEDSYEFIRQQVRKGRQVFLICPLIDDSEKLEVKSVTREYERLSSFIFKDLRVGMMHGKMTAEEKESTMEDFLKGKIDVLVSTSLVEVGVDVPNATIMVIEGAERFGLAQLHQFRGRVGRGPHQSYCFLFSDSETEIAKKRLQAITRTNSGFEIAEMDLEIRGPGEVIGREQHGLPDINMKNLMNAGLVKKTREEAKKILANYDLKNYPLLLEKLKKYQGITRLE